MSHTRDYIQRIVLVTTNKDNFFTLLSKVLKKHALDGEPIKDLVPGQTQTLDELKEYFGNSGIFYNALSRVFGADRAYLLNSFQADVDDIGAAFVDQYTRDWIEALRDHAGKDAEDILSETINSVRVLIFEIYRRIFVQALRFDSKLPADLTRSEWDKVICDLNIELLRPDQLNKVGVDVNFQTVLIKLQQKWTSKLKNVVQRIEDLNLASKTIKENTRLLGECEKHIMRFIIAELVTPQQADNNWRSCLDEKAMLVVSLEDVEKNWIKHYCQKNKINISKLSESVDTKSVVKYRDGKLIKSRTISLVELGILSEEEAQRQWFICKMSQNERVIDLYATRNWTLLLDGAIGKLGKIIQYAGWMPALLEKLKLAPLDQELQQLRTIFESLTKLDFLNKISKTDLYRNLLSHVSRAGKIQVTDLHSFKKLIDEAFLKQVKADFEDALQGFIDLSSMLGCTVGSEELSEGVAGRLATYKQKQLLPAPTMLVPVQSLLNFEYSPAQIALFEKKTLKVGQLQYPAIRIDYINNLFMGFNVVNLNHLVNFNKPEFFQGSCPFVLRIRDRLLSFEASVLTPVASTKDSGVFTEHFWARRDEEVYWLKYLCVQTAITGNVINLRFFLHALLEDPFLCSLLNFSAYSYDQLPKIMRLSLTEFAQIPEMRLLQESKLDDLVVQNAELTLGYQTVKKMRDDISTERDEMLKRMDKLEKCMEASVKSNKDDLFELERRLSAKSKNEKDAITIADLAAIEQKDKEITELKRRIPLQIEEKKPNPHTLYGKHREHELVNVKANKKSNDVAIRKQGASSSKH